MTLCTWLYNASEKSKIIFHNSQINLYVSVVFGRKFVRNLRMKHCPKSIRPKWRFTKSIPDRRRRLFSAGNLCHDDTDGYGDTKQPEDDQLEAVNRIEHGFENPENRIRVQPDPEHRNRAGSDDGQSGEVKSGGAPF
jgi:hypothetical protein